MLQWTHSSWPCNRSRLRRAAGCVAAALLLGCGTWNAAQAQDNTTPNGKHLFLASSCGICHGQMGSGGAGPALRNNRLLRVTDYVVAQIMLGRDIMPSFANKLTDAQIAAVATYIRTSWGNDFGKVSAKEAASVRQVLKQEKALPDNSILPKEQP